MSWVDWERAERFGDLTRFVAQLLALRSRHVVLSQPTFWGDAVRFTEPDAQGRALAWQVGDLCVVANAWWEPIDVDVAEVTGGGGWRRVVDTSLPPPEDIVPADQAPEVGSARLHLPRGPPSSSNAAPDPRFAAHPRVCGAASGT